MSDNDNQIKCVCKDCGRGFILGNEGDNEEYCLRCERIAWLNSREGHESDYEPTNIKFLR